MIISKQNFWIGTEQTTITAPSKKKLQETKKKKSQKTTTRKKKVVDTTAVAVWVVRLMFARWTNAVQYLRLH